MANEKNLIPLNQRSKEDAKKIQQKGGVAASEARRIQKTLRECAELLLSMSVSDTKKRNKLVAMGIEPENIDNKMLMLVGLFTAACKGDVAAEKEIRNIIGEDRAPQDEAVEKLDEILSQINEVMSRD